MNLRTALAALATVVLLIGLAPSAWAADGPPPLPSSMAAVGDSITQAASSGGSLGTDYPANSWSTGTNTTVNSHYLRLLAIDPSIGSKAFNRSVSGARMADLAGQMSVVAGLHPDYLTVLVGGNDVCQPTVAQMTSVADFRSQFVAAMDALAADSPGTYVYVVSIPNAYQLWQLFHANFWARFIWSVGNVCQSLLANPTSTQSADVVRRAQVAQRNVDFNTQLQQVCALYARCRFDGGAVYNTTFTTSDIAGDYFHPSIAGQAKLAAVTWAAGFWPNGGPVTDNPPTASFTSACKGFACSFDGSGSTDDHGITSWAWSFGDGMGGTGAVATATHTYAGAATYSVTLTVTDTAGQTASTTRSVTVTATTPTVHVSALSGVASARKGGWTATVTVSVADAVGTPVANAVVSGSWSTGGSGSCTTGGLGTCSVSANLGRKTSSTAWTVSSIAAAGYAYDSSANVKSSVPVSAP